METNHAEDIAAKIYCATGAMPDQTERDRIGANITGTAAVLGTTKNDVARAVFDLIPSPEERRVSAKELRRQFGELAQE